MSSFEERARARASWSVRRYALGEEPPDDYSALSVNERIALVHALTCEQWAFAGLEWPTYTRAETPIRIIRPTRR